MNTARFLDYVWPLFHIMHETVNWCCNHMKKIRSSQHFSLIHSFSMHLFPIPCKHQKTVRVSDVFIGQGKGALEMNGLTSSCAVSSFSPWLLLIYSWRFIWRNYFNFFWAFFFLQYESSKWCDQTSSYLNIFLYSMLMTLFLGWIS